MLKTFIMCAVTGVTLLALTGIASADHRWNGYHWPSDHLSPTVVNKTKSSLYNVPAAVTEWAALGTPIQPTLVSGKSGNITVSEAGSAFWLGLARIHIDSNGHITKGEVKLNTQALKSYPAGAADHVLCQEIGHVLGLDHNRVGDSSPNDDTCMNDQVNLKQIQYTSPNVHDTDELNAIYNHGDASATSGTSSAANGVWITVHVTPIR